MDLWKLWHDGLGSLGRHVTRVTCPLSRGSLMRAPLFVVWRSPPYGGFRLWFMASSLFSAAFGFVPATVGHRSDGDRARVRCQETPAGELFSPVPECPLPLLGSVGQPAPRAPPCGHMVQFRPAPSLGGSPNLAPVYPDLSSQRSSCSVSRTGLPTDCPPFESSDQAEMRNPAKVEVSNGSAAPLLGQDSLPA